MQRIIRGFFTDKEKRTQTGTDIIITSNDEFIKIGNHDCDFIIAKSELKDFIEEGKRNE